MRTLIKTVAVILAAGVLLTAGGLTALYMYDSPPEGIPAEGEIFRVEEGQNLSEISRELEEQGLIRSRYMLVGMSRLRKTGGMIRAGYYRILPGMSTTDVHELLVEGRQTLHKVTIPEGWTVSMIAQRLEREGICPAKEFVAAAKDPAMVRKELDLPIPAGAESVQGFLFPDTYLFQRAYPAEKVLSHMVKTFFENLEDIAPAYDELPAGELYDKIVLASIVEREYRAEEEAAKIASVFYNRLEGGCACRAAPPSCTCSPKKWGRSVPKSSPTTISRYGPTSTPTGTGDCRLRR